MLVCFSYTWNIFWCKDSIVMYWTLQRTQMIPLIYTEHFNKWHTETDFIAADVVVRMRWWVLYTRSDSSRYRVVACKCFFLSVRCQLKLISIGALRVRCTASYCMLAYCLSPWRKRWFSAASRPHLFEVRKYIFWFLMRGPTFAVPTDTSCWRICRNRYTRRAVHTGLKSAQKCLLF